MSGFFNLTQLWRSWVACRWPKCFVGFLQGACMREWVRCACIKKKKKKSFSLKRAEKGSVTSMKVNDASFPCPPSAPWYLSFYSVGRKSLSKAYFFFLPATLPPFALESAAIILGQIVAMLSGACGTRQDSWNNWDIDHPQPWPWPLLHSCHYFNRSFESFQKCIQWKIFPFLSQGGLAEVEDFCL